MHLIIDTEDTVNAAPADGEGSVPPHPDEGEGSQRQPMPFSSSGQGDKPTECVAVAAAALQLLQEELLPRLFPGVAPQPPSSHGSSDSATAVTTVMVQRQQSIITAQYQGHVNDSAAELYGTASHTPPSVIRVSPAALYCQPHSLTLAASPAAVCCTQDPAALTPAASPPEEAACLPISGGSWITVWLQLSAPLPSEGVVLLARHRGGFLDARLEREDDSYGALIIKVRAS